MMKTLQIRVSGRVQGVGFRPFVYRLARDLNLAGQVSNTRGGVSIHLQGALPALEDFKHRLLMQAPIQARISACQEEWLDTSAYQAFTIAPSLNSQETLSLQVPLDTRPCPACLEEMFNPRDRRWRYAFINCTQCGPRYTLMRQRPYDRPHTSMQAFEQCPACLDEYQNPADRRFHAQPNACAQCGPRLWCSTADGEPLSGDPLERAVAGLQAGKILAIRGMGGFHLMCAADDPAAIAQLRHRKCRPHKPLAIMALNGASLEPWVQLSREDRALLESAAAPLLIVPYKEGAASQLMVEALAPGLKDLGVLLPSTPLHWLLFHTLLGQPKGSGWLQHPLSIAWVATSANRSGQPLITDNHQALEQLADIADLWLLHDREMITGCDDSVFQASRSPRALVRPGRGLAPVHLTLSEASPVRVLALGAYLKTSVCLLGEDQACLSQYVGDLDQATTCRRLRATAEHLCQLLDFQPEVICSDLHPDVYSSRLAEELARQWQLPWLQVQHHHAHVAAVMAEFGLQERVLGLVLDGQGLGEEGQARGGELLEVNPLGFIRLGELAPLLLPGGDQAAREPWRLAAGVLHQLGLKASAAFDPGDQPGHALLQKLLARPHLCRPTTSAGRLFDAAAGLLGVCSHQSHEAQAAMQLEALVRGLPTLAERLWTLKDGQLSFWPLLSAVSTLTDPREGAEVFHAGLVGGLEAWLERASEDTGLRKVVLSGGCFLNGVLRQALLARLQARGLEVYFPQRVSVNDTGLALGQAWVASMARKADESQFLERLSYVPGRTGPN
ncbi:carbamoyltransferase HypF [Ectothiorhodospira sp. 9100]|uniref:carbamoyltransferase HypF n=2 Tax=unclassified Ectothiorhodospira TaxID=2684909 RepID=UPI001EE91422|nr:carbamoyltransferase HypF [Ectothiorhodospira sp. 9100]MCG5514823.1 carbamoyltransferase HypF [Ectothiorhodospira sp. 9100]MCG5517623.1 carbamoyltransferase HypF [Ectothiorhodospira sp. 9905]